MTINAVINTVNTSPVQTTKSEDIDKNKSLKSNGEVVKKDTEIVDKFEKSETKSDATYKKPVAKRDEETIERIKAEVEQANSNLINLVKKLLEKQGMTFNDLKIDGPDIEIDEETRVEAKKAIDEGGEYSIENVSDKLVDFAKAISGGDKSKIGLLRDAIEKGFKEAEDAFGGELPEISHKTLARTLEKLDAWGNEEA